MRPVEKYIQAMKNRDYQLLGELFTSDGHYNDYCALLTAQSEYHLYGKEAISMFFRNKFLVHQYSIFDSVILNNQQVEFIAQFGNQCVVAIATLQQITSDGLIRRLTVRPK